MRASEFYDIVTEAVNDVMEHGYSQKRLEYWLQRLEEAAELALVPQQELERMLQKTLTSVYARATKQKNLLTLHKGIGEFTLRSIEPKLHGLLEERIRASADLIVLNREQSVAKTLQRFAGWCSSVPAGGTTGDKVETRKTIRRGIAGLPFETRRVVIDQGHKLAASINDLVATDGGAIAGIYRSHWRESGYDFRPSHKARDLKIYVIRGNWAIKQGLMKLAGRQYYDQITQAAEEPFCRCFMEYLYHVSQLPRDMLTAKGAEALSSARAQLRAIA